MNISQINESLGRSGPANETRQFLANQIRRRNYLNFIDDLKGRNLSHEPNVDQVPILWLSNLINSVPNASGNCPNSYRDLKPLSQIAAQLFRQLRGPGRENVDVLSHPRSLT
jgi:hypothetical protein